jgi:hypothetical protein
VGFYLVEDQFVFPAFGVDGRQFLGGGMRVFGDGGQQADRHVVFAAAMDHVFDDPDRGYGRTSSSLSVPIQSEAVSRLSGRRASDTWDGIGSCLSRRVEANRREFGDLPR